jgi:hypothetical protein
MEGDTKIALALVCVLAIALAVWAYHKGWFVLSEKNAPPAAGEKFVGAYGRTPGMQNCLATRDDGKWSYFNRCMWV